MYSDQNPHNLFTAISQKCGNYVVQGDIRQKLSKSPNDIRDTGKYKGEKIGDIWFAPPGVVVGISRGVVSSE
jgi:hypothetical protein